MLRLSDINARCGHSVITGRSADAEENEWNWACPGSNAEYFRSAGVKQMSGCLSVSGVTDYRAHDGGVYLSIAPAIAGCNYGGIDRVRVMPGANGATAELAQGALAIGMTAMTTGKRIQIFFDDAAVECNVAVVSLGGHSGQCN